MRWAAAAAVLFLGLVIAWPGATTPTVQVIGLGGAVAVAYAAVSHFAALWPGEPGAEPAQSSDPVAEEYTRLRRQIELAVQPDGGADAFLARELREIARRLLLVRGVDLGRDEERARRLVGDGAWEVIRPGHRNATIGADKLNLVLTRLEAL